MTGLFGSSNVLMKRVGPGQLYVVPAPTTDPGSTAELPTYATTPTQKSVEGYYAQFYGAANVAAKKVLQAGMNPYLSMDSGGMDLKVKPSTVTFDPLNAPKWEMTTGIDTASAELNFYEVEPSHLVDLFGAQASDLLAVVAAQGVAARKIALLGAQSYNQFYSTLYRIPSSMVPGEFWHYLFPAASMVADLELKLSKKDELKAKLSLQLQPSPFLFNSAGNGVVIITDDPTAPALP